MKYEIRKKNVLRLFTYLLFVFLTIGLSNTVALASENISSVVKVNNGEEEYDLTDHLQILQDTKRVFTIDSIFYPEIRDKFKSYKESNLSGEISSAAYWVRVVVQNDQDQAANMFLEISKPQLSNLKFYRFDGQRLIEEVDTGSDYPFSNREINNRNFVFDLHLPSKETQTIILRVEAKSYLQLPVKLYTEKHFIEKEEHSNMVLGFYYGIMLIMLLYNLILYFSLKDETYIYYCCFIFAFSIMQLIWDGLAFQYLWPKLVFWNTKANPVFIILSAMFSLQFTRSFLRVKERSRFYDKLMSCMLFTELIAVIAAILIPVAIATEMSVFIITASSAICFASIKLVGVKERAVQLYVVSWIALFLGSSLNILTAYKILPLSFITLYSPRIGAVINIVLLSLSLGDRFNIMRQEKVIEEKQRILLENLHDITKTITSTNDIGTMVTFLLQRICKITKFHNGMIVLKEDQGYVVKATLGYKAEQLKNKILFQVEQDLYFQKTIKENHSIILNDVVMHAYGIDRSFKAFIEFPITYHKKNVGIIVLYDDTIDDSNGAQYEVLYNFTGQVGIAIENARLFNQVEKLATTDGLTGAYTRTHFFNMSESIIEEHRNSNKCVSLIMLDIDYFKKINDTYGHLIGDKTLQQLVSTIKMELTEDCIIGRYGGEEFLVLLKDTNLDTAIYLAEKLREKIENMNIEIDKDNFIKSTISIGVANTSENTFKISQLIEKADQALYLSKQNGRNKVSTVKISV
ncbi:diguanylate cyclase [Clostridium sp. YIM B02505]|uniref:Diguanylate cyclase n=1 Tax=Clostridium yunnanense TaxID=2800325 RepID=A0ABS1EU09_9CLOT|nr:diguanylate cyclase [Clostridium yunnanense]MBK1812778.1 diguanylate cyclase [Clostridium yunnanense]